MLKFVFPVFLEWPVFFRYDKSFFSFRTKVLFILFLYVYKYIYIFIQKLSLNRARGGGRPLNIQVFFDVLHYRLHASFHEFHKEFTKVVKPEYFHVHLKQNLGYLVLQTKKSRKGYSFQNQYYTQKKANKTVILRFTTLTCATSVVDTEGESYRKETNIPPPPKFR